MHRRQPISSQSHSGLHGTTRGSDRLRWKRGAALNLFLHSTAQWCGPRGCWPILVINCEHNLPRAARVDSAVRTQ
jgi:hypothetical protein